jgi:hypothetical protein
MCSKEAPLCGFPEELFWDNVPIPRARSLGETGPGEWYFDYDNKQVYVGSTPTGHQVELATRSFAFRGAAARVTIRGLAIEKYAVSAQSAAVDAQGRDWTVQSNEIRFNHGWGVRIAPGMKLVANFIHDNGQLGVGGTGDGVVIEDNEVARNNIARFESGWEAGGVKIFRSSNLRVVGNYVCENIGSGLWTDTDNSNVSYLNNTVENNWGPGIQHEISFSALIRGNVLRNNGRGGSPWLWGAQILVQNSHDVEVTENQVEVSAKGGNGISVVQQDRGPEYMVRNVEVHHNDITYWGRNGMSGAAADFQSGRLFGGNNSFHDNSYHALDPTFPHWAWQDQERNWSAFRSVGQERNGIVNSAVPPPRLRRRAEQSSELPPGLPSNSPFRSPSICR